MSNPRNTASMSEALGGAVEPKRTPESPGIKVFELAMTSVFAGGRAEPELEPVERRRLDPRPRHVARAVAEEGADAAVHLGQRGQLGLVARLRALVAERERLLQGEIGKAQLGFLVAPVIIHTDAGTLPQPFQGGCERSHPHIRSRSATPKAGWRSTRHVASRTSRPSTSRHSPMFSISSRRPPRDPSASW